MYAPIHRLIKRIHHLEKKVIVNERVLREILSQYASPIGDVGTVYDKIADRVEKEFG